MTGDDQTWLLHNGDEAFRSYFTTFFDLRESDWDEGWGWRKTDATWPFTKMFNAAFLLDRGINDLPYMDYRFWSNQVILRSTPNVKDLKARANPAVIGDRRVVVPVRNAGSNNLLALMHYYRSQTTNGMTPWAVEDVRQAIVDRSLLPEDIASDVVPVEGPLGRLYIFGRHPYGDLVVYWKDGYSQYSPWQVLKIASGPPPSWVTGAVKPVAITRLEEDGEAIHVFVTDANGHLRRHWKTKTGFWQSEDVSARLASDNPNSTDDYLLSGEPPAVFSGAQLVVVTRRRQTNDPVIFTYGRVAKRETREQCFNLIFFEICVPIPTFFSSIKWTVHNLPTSYSLASNRSLAVVDNVNNGEWHVYGVNGAWGHVGELIHFFGRIGGAWSSENVTTLPNIGSNYRVSGRLIATRDHNIYARNDSGEIVHYYLSANGWSAENLTTDYSNIGPTFRISAGFSGDGNLAVARGAGGSHHLYALNNADQLLRYYWYSNTGWRAENVTGASGTRMVNGPRLGSGDDGITIYGISRPVTNNAGINIGNQLLRYAGTLSRSWHSNRDYSTWASGSRHGFEYEPSTGDDLISCFGDNIACSYPGLIFDNRIEIWCPGFNEQGPGLRAGTMLHESTHMIFSSIFGGWPHQNGKDDWYHHGLLTYTLGSLEATNSHRHSMYQIQAEYLADLAEFPAPGVPFSVTNEALVRANQIINNNIKNAVGWSVGLPRPLY